MTTTYAGPTDTDLIRVGGGATPGRWSSFWRGRRHDPAWNRPALVALLLGTGVLYLWNLAASGYANSYYTAAVKAGATSWRAMLFGSLDSANFITVDKPPASLWVMDISAKIFGAKGRGGCPERAGDLSRRASLGGTSRRSAGRPRARGDAGRGIDVPVQQPGRTAGAVDDGRLLRDRPGG